MSLNLIFFIVIIVAGLLGFVMVKVDELSGIGRSTSAFRNPHGRLVRTKKLDAVTDNGYGTRLKRALIPSLAVALVVTVVTAVPLTPFDFSGNIPVSLTLLLTVAILTAIGHEEHRAWRTLALALIGFLLLGAIGVAVVSALQVALGFAVSTSFMNVLTVWLGALGAALAVATLAPTTKFAREFEDGTVSNVVVSVDSVAAKAYAPLEDAAWNGKAAV